MNNKPATIKEWGERIVLALLFIIIGGVVMVVFKPWGSQVVHNNIENYLWRIGLSMLLLVVAWLVHRSPLTRKYWQVFFGLFILSVAGSLDWIFGRFLRDSLQVSDSTLAGQALPKVNELVLIAAVVIVLTRLSGADLGSIYLQKGKLKLGLIIGGSAFLIAALGSIPTAGLLFKAEGLTITQILPWVPWILTAALANGALEEILFRGLFLRKLEPFFGKLLSNILIALVFTVLHLGSSYTSDQYIFLVILLPAALAWGYVMQKTDSLWGSILFHAGMDLPVFIGIFATLV